MKSITRRSLIAGASSLPLAACAHSEAANMCSATPDSFIIDVARQPDDIFPLWPDGAPGGENTNLNEHYVSRENSFGLPDRAVREITNPTLSFFRATAPSNGITLLIAPGGGYFHVVVEKEGYEGARYFNQFGFDVYVMNYRLPHQGWAAGPDTPLQDAQRAVRLVRQKASPSDQIAMIGFSAGGHVVGSLTQRYDVSVYQAIDAADELSARPDLSALLYPVALMGSEFTHKGSETNLLGNSPSPVQLDQYDLAHAPNPDSPPVFLLHALDDTSVPFENSLQLTAAYRRTGVKAVLHSFVSGGHGFGMRGIENTPLAAWPGLFIDWANQYAR